MINPECMMLSGERFAVTYGLRGDQAGALSVAQDICLEQTVELPWDLVVRRGIREQIVGQVASFRSLSPDRHEAVITFAVEIAGLELTQLLNVVFGNISLKAGIRVERLDLAPSMTAALKGPRYGRHGLRDLLGVHGRPLLCTALKPMGLSPAELADLAYRFALGGIDLIKDDHGLANQPFCPFQERLERCAEAVNRANGRTGLRSLYVPHITAPAHLVLERARQARAAGAGGLLISPGLTGLDAMRLVADDEAVALPILSHPALLGSYMASPCEGISPFVLFGQLPRLAGADGTIFPNHGGRFRLTADQCLQVAQGTTSPLGGLRPIFPTPAGGMRLERLPEMTAFYGEDVIFLIGADLLRQGPDLMEWCRRFLSQGSELSLQGGER